MDETKRKIIFTPDITETLQALLNETKPDKLFIITDSNVKGLMEKEDFPTGGFLRIEFPFILSFNAGEHNKNLSTVTELWTALIKLGASRQSIILNLGGGVVTDMGGFAASTFKRGLKFVNIPTTLLGIVDAAVGGKTGFDFGGLKNEIGIVSQPLQTIIHYDFLKTLPERELLSGMGEVVKTAMISSAEAYKHLLLDFTATPELIEKCVRFKERITDEDPNEKGIRKILNFGHTAGHAFESLLIEKGIDTTHGECVAHGIMVALILSHIKLGLPSVVLHQYNREILSNYRRLPVGCKDHDLLMEKIKHDKKNSGGSVRFVLLKDIGIPEWDIAVEGNDIKEALEIYCDMM